MKIRMLTDFDDGTVHLKKGDDGDGLTEYQRKRMVRVGLAEKVEPADKAPGKAEAKD